MPDFSDIDKLRKYLEKHCTEVLEKEVFKSIQEEMIETVEEEVYGKYHSYAKNPYVRKEEHGGLKDPKNIKGYIVNGKLIVRNERMDIEGRKSDRNVAEVVEYGSNYNWVQSDIYKNPFPRPFTRFTVLRLQGNSKHIIAMKKGLEKRGFNVE